MVVKKAEPKTKSKEDPFTDLRDAVEAFADDLGPERTARMLRELDAASALADRGE